MEHDTPGAPKGPFALTNASVVTGDADGLCYPG
jgi:hypothetical protein